jgi:ribosome maturation factor RimP
MSKSGDVPLFVFYGRVKEGQKTLIPEKSDILAMVREIVEKCGYECVLARFVTERKNSVLRVFIDSVGGISVKDCEIVSRAIIDRLNAAAPDFLEKFSLEVSSPGIERPLFSLDDYIRFHGKTVKIRLSEPFGGKRQHTGTILSVEGDFVSIAESESRETLRIPFSLIASGHIVYKNTPEEKGHVMRRSE